VSCKIEDSKILFAVPPPPSPPIWKTCSSDSWAKVQEIVSIFVALGVRTRLKLLYTATTDEPPELLYEVCCSSQYKSLLLDSWRFEDWKLLDSSGEVHIEGQVAAYLKTKSREEMMGFILDTRTSDYYAVVFEVLIKACLTANANAMMMRKSNPEQIPEKLDERFKTFDQYVSRMVSMEQETRGELNEFVTKSGSLLLAVRDAIEDGLLDDNVVAILKQKLWHLQERFQDGTSALWGQEKSYDLFYPFDEDWW
jgi:hypothetical protein